MLRGRQLLLISLPLICSTSLVYLWLWSKLPLRGHHRGASLFLMNAMSKNDHEVRVPDEIKDVLIEAAKRQQLRQQQLKNYCLQHRHTKRPEKQELSSFLVDDQNKMIYCNVAKVGSTPWKMTLMRLWKNVKFNITETAVHTWRLWTHLSELSTEKISKRLSKYFKFLFVREPFHRMLSAYKDKFFGKNRLYTDAIRWKIVSVLRPNDVEPVGLHTNNVTFTEFLKYVSTYSDRLAKDPHWRNYEEQCFPCHFQFDFIGSFENLADDAALLLRMAGIDDKAVFPPVRPSSASSDFAKHYSKVPYDVIVKFAEAYRGDFDMFGYPFPDQHKDIISNKTN